jgi:hypothetical protein
VIEGRAITLPLSLSLSSFSPSLSLSQNFTISVFLRLSMFLVYSSSVHSAFDEIAQSSVNFASPVE